MHYHYVLVLWKAQNFSTIAELHMMSKDVTILVLHPLSGKKTAESMAMDRLTGWKTVKTCLKWEGATVQSTVQTDSASV